MRSRNRPASEYAVDDRRIRQRADRGRPAPPDPRPELRIVRMAATDPSYLTHDWGDYLNDFGKRNYRHGTARALGSVAITLVPARAMSQMVAEKYPRAKNRQDSLEKIRDNVRKYLRNCINDTRVGVENQRETAMGFHASDFNISGISNEIYSTADDESGWSSGSAEYHELLLADPVESSTASNLPLAAGSFAVSRLGLYGRGYGIDLTMHEQIYDERRQIIRYLRQGEGLSTGALERDGWEAHATIFKFRDDVGVTPLRRQDEMPPTIDFEPVRALLS